MKLGVAAWGAVLAAGMLRAAAQEAEAPATEPYPATVPVAAESPPPPEAERADSELDDVVVTARKRRERTLDVPASIAVLDGEALSDAGLTLPTDIQERVPGLVVSVPNARLTSYTIRGLGSSSANDGIESSVGLFLDGIYLGRQGVSIFDLIDLDRVEVLRGPQGTLFGKNTTAGAIHFVTKAPVDAYEARLESTLGNLGAKQLRGSINDGIVSGTLAGRLTGYLSQRDGTVDNVYDGGKLNDRDKHGFRGQLLWTPLPDLSGRIIGEFASNHETCCAFPLTAPVRRPVAERDAYMEYDRVGTDYRERRTDSDAPTRSDMRQHAASAEFNWELGDHVATSITGWRNWHFVPLNDDATSLHLASTSTLNDHEQLSQELRLLSDFGAFETVAGVYFVHQDLRGLERVILGDDVAGWVFGGVARERGATFLTESNSGPVLYALIPPETFDGMTVDTDYTQASDGLAGFLSLDWHPIERIDVSLGVRYTHEEKDSAVDRTRYGGDPDATLLSSGDPVLIAASPIFIAAAPFVDPIEEVLGLELPTRGFTGVVDDVAGGEYSRDTQYSEGDWSGQASLSFKLTADALAYVSAARGYKGGGINLGFTGESIEPTFRPEQATSYEAGVKARLLRNLLSMALTVYDTRVRDYQALTFDNEPTLLPNPRQINLLNVGHVRLRGAELEGYGFAAEGLMLRAGVAYSRAVTTEFSNAPNEDTRENDKDLSGHDLYNAPRWSATAGADYRYFFDAWGRGLEFYAGLDHMYRSGYWGTVEHGRASYIEAYDVSNLRTGIGSASKAWDLSLWSRNIFDREYVAAVYPLYGVGDYGAVPSDPRTVGATLRILLQ